MDQSPLDKIICRSFSTRRPVALSPDRKPGFRSSPSDHRGHLSGLIIRLWTIPLIHLRIVTRIMRAATYW